MMKCNECDADFEYPIIVESGPHLKALCPACSAYIKFVSARDLPTLEQLRLLIWNRSQQDERFINSCKVLCKFDLSKAVTYNEVFVQYWNLLHTILIMLQRASQPSQNVL